MDIDWTYRREHLEKHNVTYIEANEAANDPSAVVLNPDPASHSGRSVRIIGWSSTAEMLLTVIMVPDGETVWGASAWPSNTRDENLYSANIKR